MLYIIRVLSMRSDRHSYDLYETHTESVIKATKEIILELVNKTGMETKNFKIERDILEINEWPHKITYNRKEELEMQAKYVLLCNEGQRGFKMIEPRNTVNYVGEHNLKSLIDLDRVSNCNYTEEKNRIYRSRDTYNVKTDPKFEKHIASKYEEFLAKTAMLGLNTRFSYNIEGEDVKLIFYYGTSKRVIIPSFITTIRESAFMFKDIEQLTLNEGLKYIGNNAFSNNKLKSVIIPDSVIFVGKDVFDPDLSNGGYTTIYTKLNPNTIMFK